MRAAVIGNGADLLTAVAVDVRRMWPRLDDGRGRIVVLVGGNPGTPRDHTMTPEPEEQPMESLTLLGQPIGTARDVMIDVRAVSDVLNDYAASVRRDERRRIAALPWWKRLRGTTP